MCRVMYFICCVQTVATLPLSVPANEKDSSAIQAPSFLVGQISINAKLLEVWPKWLSLCG